MSGYVYIVAPEARLHRPQYSEGRLAKIGYTSGNPNARLRALQTGSPLTLKLWCYFSGTMELERALHDTFRPLSSHGEWFFVENKLECFLSWLGEEPNTGQFITEEQLAVAVFDTIFARGAPHPDFDESEWLASADPRYIAGYFPDEWQESLEWV